MTLTPSFKLVDSVERDMLRIEESIKPRAISIQAGMTKGTLVSVFVGACKNSANLVKVVGGLGCDADRHFNSSLWGSEGLLPFRFT